MQSGSLAWRTLDAIYEPSAIVQLADGRFLVVEDEKAHPFCLFSLDGEGHVVDRRSLTPGWFDFNDRFWKLDDLEGLALNDQGWIYAVTSQSLDGDGERKKSREKFVRFRIEGERIVDAGVSSGLKDALVAAHPVLEVAARVVDVKGAGGLNIEAMDSRAGGQHVLIGLRGPLLDGRALIACVENQEEIFEAGETPRIGAKLAALDLGGGGVRGMSWIPGLSGHLLISGPVSRERGPFRLWLWSGRAEDPALPVSIPDLPDIAHAEGVCPARIAGRQQIILVSDDGDRKAGRCARHALIDLDRLRIGGP